MRLLRYLIRILFWDWMQSDRLDASWRDAERARHER